MFHIEYVLNGEVIRCYDVDSFSIDNSDLLDFSVSEHDDFQVFITYID